VCGGGGHDVDDGLPVTHKVHDVTLGSTFDASAISWGSSGDTSNAAITGAP